jgi:opacity protein-like surface antigen
MSGWYLRGDVGYRWNSIGPTQVWTTIPTASENYQNSMGYGAGFGFKYRWFRTDLTLDMGGPSKVSGTTVAAAPQPQYSAKVSTLTVLANAYFDLGSWAGITPYVGGGIGITRLTSEQYADTTLATPGSFISGPGRAQNFSWAAMAGVAFQVRPNWMIDVGVRHLYLGDILAAENNAGTGNTAVTFKNLSAQEARIGVRYLFE